MSDEFVNAVSKLNLTLISSATYASWTIATKFMQIKTRIDSLEQRCERLEEK